MTRQTCIFLSLLIAFLPVVMGDIAVSGMGYHPDSFKQAVIYGSAFGNAQIIDASGAVVGEYPITKAVSYDNKPKKCLGDIECSVAYFTDFKKEGKYYIKAGNEKSPEFTISKTVYKDTASVLEKFFEATRQQDSSFHADFHAYGTPRLRAMADGSFIMEADQASTTLIALGNAYMNSPQVFEGFEEHVKNYLEYLISLQGIKVVDDPSGFRLNENVEAQNAFVPGPTNIKEVDVYLATEPPRILKTLPVKSLCGESSSAGFQQCMDNAKNFYKCQAGEVCLNLTYVEKRGRAEYNSEDMSLSTGWYYEFGCYIDIDLNERLFDDGYNPCLIFKAEKKASSTIRALAAYSTGLPVIKDYYPEMYPSLLERAEKTYSYVLAKNKGEIGDEDNAGYLGAAAFILYDHTKNKQYLAKAYELRTAVTTVFISDDSHGNALYWEQYVLHKKDLETQGYAYTYQGKKPEEFFHDKIYYDYKDRGYVSLGNNAERAYQLDPMVEFQDNFIQFQNSRYMLMESLYALVAKKYYAGAADFITPVGENQLHWLTGMNRIQYGASANSPQKSISFIFGIGKYPSEYHSRYLMDSGYNSASGGNCIGIRGTSLKYKDGNNYVPFDGVSQILGYNLGTSGNGYGGESSAEFFKKKTYLNGLNYIPGWITGAYDISARNDPLERDTIPNYVDNAGSWEFTETENRIVALALETLAYLDNQYNGEGGNTDIPSANSTEGKMSVNTVPTGADIYINGSKEAVSPAIISLSKGYYNITAKKIQYMDAIQGVDLDVGETINLNLVLIRRNGTNITGPSNDTVPDMNNTVNNTANNTIAKTGFVNFTSEPTGALITMDEVFLGNTPFIKKAEAGVHNFSAKYNNDTQKKVFEVIENNTLSYLFMLSNHSIQANNSITRTQTSLELIDGAYHILAGDTASFSVTLKENGTVGWYEAGVLSNTTTGIVHHVSWRPSHLVSANITPANVTAKIGENSYTWPVLVEFVINPFFSNIDGGADIRGSKDSMINVITNDRIHIFQNLSVDIENAYFRTTDRYYLNRSTGNGETIWKKELTDMQYGDNFVVRAIGYGQVNITFEFGLNRAHERYFPASSSSSSSSGSSSGGGGSGSGGGSPVGTGSVVYARFDPGLVNTSQSIILLSDVKINYGEIKQVTAKILTPYNDYIQKNLTLAAGTNSYGLWTTNISGLLPGKYYLKEMEITSLAGKTFTNSSIAASFFVEGASLPTEKLSLINIVLNASRVESGSLVSVRLDARDSSGITSVVLTGHTSRDGLFTNNLSLFAGTNQYGTWEADLAASSPDTSFFIDSVTLKNKEQERTYSISDRSFYVNPAPKSYLTAAAILQTPEQWVKEFIEKPLVPSLIGFSLMIILILLFLGYHYGRNVWKRDQ